jgi:hypothetical protein
MVEEVSMKHTFKIVASLAVLAAGMACAESQSGTELSRADLQTMIRSAHSAQQYQALATYFRGRQQALEKQAQAEKAEWDRRSQVTASVAQKYPRPVDSSRNRYEYFTNQANQMGQQAAHYESLLTNAQQVATK